MPAPTRAGSVLALAALLAAGTASAHHGWSWAEPEQSELAGVVRAVSMAPPHPSLEVEAEDGTLWRIDLSNPRQTAASGFDGDSAEPGDAIQILGNRSAREGERLMKAVRILVDGQVYDIYPDRIRTP
ncbi:hypothetical protein CNY89_08320 [Amaricoccus sp. HAR-UPW-R2A-40]|nr:hypothetical protein CNY89_08320 [Amaricoccus sp. HAR-UPW-R2A-40]